MFYVLNTKTLTAVTLTNARKVSIYMLGRAYNDYIIIKTHYTDRVVDISPSHGECSMIEILCEDA